MVEDKKPKSLDNSIYYFYLIFLNTTFLFLGLYFNIEFIVGIPSILYGIYRLFSKRIWKFKVLSEIGFTYNPSIFLQDDEAKKVAIKYILLGGILSITFQILSFLF